MGASRKTTKSTSSGSSRKGHWKNLTRDSRGRWVKRQSSSAVKSQKKPAVKRSKKAPQGKPAGKKVPPTKPKQASQILDGIQKDFEKICPRCSGDLKFFKIRCGPQKLVSVRKCNVCNFWIPITNK
ncbi:MAG: hypothetical protein ACTSWW_02435 [Promethearchaeota archaeon]